MGRSIVGQCFKRKVEAIQNKLEDKSDKKFTKRANRFAARYSVNVANDKKGLTARPIFANELQQSVESNSNNLEESAVKQIQPIMYFLASTLNVELVYIILTGLTQCLHIKKDEAIAAEVSENVTIR